MGLKFARGERPRIYTLEEHYRENPTTNQNLAAMLFTRDSTAFYLGQDDWLNGSTFTYEAWLCPTSVTGQQAIICKSGGNARPYHTRWLYIEEGTLVLNQYNGNQNVLKTSKVMQPNVWQHVACTSGDGMLRIFLNGELIAQQAAGGPGMGQYDQAETVVGGRPTDSGLTAEFGGMMDEIRIWNLARSPAQIKANVNIRLTAESVVGLGYAFNCDTVTQLLGNSGLGGLTPRPVKATMPELVAVGELPNIIIPNPPVLEPRTFWTTGHADSGGFDAERQEFSFEVLRPIWFNRATIYPEGFAGRVGEVYVNGGLAARGVFASADGGASVTLDTAVKAVAGNTLKFVMIAQPNAPQAYISNSSYFLSGSITEGGLMRFTGSNANRYGPRMSFTYL